MRQVLEFLIAVHVDQLCLFTLLVSRSYLVLAKNLKCYSKGYQRIHMTLLFNIKLIINSAYIFNYYLKCLSSLTYVLNHL